MSATGLLHLPSIYCFYDRNSRSRRTFESRCRQSWRRLEDLLLSHSMLTMILDLSMLAICNHAGAPLALMGALCRTCCCRGILIFSLLSCRSSYRATGLQPSRLSVRNVGSLLKSIRTKGQSRRAVNTFQNGTSSKSYLCIVAHSARMYIHITARAQRCVANARQTQDGRERLEIVIHRSVA